MDKKKIVLFDSWTRGLIHIFRLLNTLESRAIDILLVHVGSWGNDKDRPIQENINGLKVHDIKNYKNLKDVLKVEQPDAVFFLSLDPLSHRTFNRYCIHNNVPTVNLYHGVHSVFHTLTSSKKHILEYWKFLTTRLRENLGYVLYEYVLSLIHTRASIKIWYELLIDIVKKFFGLGIINARGDALTNYICVFNEFDSKHAQKKYLMPKKQIKIVGTPDILKFTGLESSIGKYAEEDSIENKIILYIGTGIRSTNMRVADDLDYFNHLFDTYKVLKELNKKMVLKLHYSRLESMVNMFSKVETDIEFCDNECFVNTLKESCGAIVEPSTAALVPAFMGKPIFLAQYGPLSGLKFGPAIMHYPKAFSVDNFTGLNKIIDPLISNVDSKSVKNWISLATGPLPASAMPSRVVDVLELAINEK